MIQYAAKLSVLKLRHLLAPVGGRPLRCRTGMTWLGIVGELSYHLIPCNASLKGRHGTATKTAKPTRKPR
jgi:hypothetical protein